MKKIRYDRIPTEKRHSQSRHLDRLKTDQIVALMTADGGNVLRALAKARRSIALAADLIAEALSRGGRLFFIGAGTSGRLGILEAAECPPTFNTPPSLIRGIMAGGRRSVFRSKEGAEDSSSDGRLMTGRWLRKGDILVGVAASGVTPFVQAALRVAQRRGAATVLVTCNPQMAHAAAADIVIALSTGPEVLSGSTRLKAGTACKMTLNMLTTASMVRLGKVYDNWMVDLQPKSKKLVARGERLIAQLGKVAPRRAHQLFQQAEGRVKVAIVMARLAIDRPEALRRLRRAKGFLREVIG